MKKVRMGWALQRKKDGHVMNRLYPNRAEALEQIDDETFFTAERFRAVKVFAEIPLRKPRRRRGKPFLGYTVCFKGCTETLEKVFGKKEISTEKMTQKLWNYLQKRKLIKAK